MDTLAAHALAATLLANEEEEYGDADDDDALSPLLLSSSLLIKGRASSHIRSCSCSSFAIHVLLLAQSSPLSEKTALGEIDVTCARFSFLTVGIVLVDDAKVFDDIDVGVDAISVLLTFRERAWNE